MLSRRQHQLFLLLAACTHVPAASSPAAEVRYEGDKDADGKFFFISSVVVHPHPASLGTQKLSAQHKSHRKYSHAQEVCNVERLHEKTACARFCGADSSIVRASRQAPWIRCRDSAGWSHVYRLKTVIQLWVSTSAMRKIIENVIIEEAPTEPSISVLTHHSSLLQADSTTASGTVDPSSILCLRSLPHLACHPSAALLPWLSPHRRNACRTQGRATSRRATARTLAAILKTK